MKNKVGIYQIRNLITGRVYIGQSICLNKRVNDHFSALRRGKHNNKHLQNSFNKHGESNFIFEYLVYCEEKELTRYEQGILDYKPLNYNKREIVDSNKGNKLYPTIEHRKNLSFAYQSMSEEKKKDRANKISISHTGRKNTEEHNKNISIGKKGKPMSEENKEICRLSHIGIKPSLEARINMSKAKKGEKHPNYGKKLSKESIEKRTNTRKKKELEKFLTGDLKRNPYGYKENT